MFPFVSYCKKMLRNLCSHCAVKSVHYIHSYIVCFQFVCICGASVMTCLSCLMTYSRFTGLFHRTSLHGNEQQRQPFCLLRPCSNSLKDVANPRSSNCSSCCCYLLFASIFLIKRFIYGVQQVKQSFHQGTQVNCESF